MSVMAHYQFSIINSPLLYRHDFFLFSGQHFVDLLDVLVVHLLQLLFAALLCVFGQAFLDGFLQLVDGVATVRFLRK